MGQSPLLLETEGNQETHKLLIKYNIFEGFLGRILSSQALLS